MALGNRGMTVELPPIHERVESPGTYVTELVSRGHFCLAPRSYSPPVIWWLSPGEGWDAVT